MLDEAIRVAAEGGVPEWMARQIIEAYEAEKAKEQPQRICDTCKGHGCPNCNKTGFLPDRRKNATDQSADHIVEANKMVQGDDQPVEVSRAAFENIRYWLDRALNHWKEEPMGPNRELCITQAMNATNNALVAPMRESGNADLANAAKRIAPLMKCKTIAEDLERANAIINWLVVKFNITQIEGGQS